MCQRFHPPLPPHAAPPAVAIPHCAGSVARRAVAPFGEIGVAGTAEAVRAKFQVLVHRRFDRRAGLVGGHTWRFSSEGFMKGFEGLRLWLSGLESTTLKGLKGFFHVSAVYIGFLHGFDER